MILPPFFSLACLLSFFEHDSPSRERTRLLSPLRPRDRPSVRQSLLCFASPTSSPAARESVAGPALFASASSLCRTEARRPRPRDDDDDDESDVSSSVQCRDELPALVHMLLLRLLFSYLPLSPPPPPRSSAERVVGIVARSEGPATYYPSHETLRGGERRRGEYSRSVYGGVAGMCTKSSSDVGGDLLAAGRRTWARDVSGNRAPP